MTSTSISLANLLVLCCKFLHTSFSFGLSRYILVCFAYFVSCGFFLFRLNLSLVHVPYLSYFSHFSICYPIVDMALNVFVDSRFIVYSTSSIALTRCLSFGLIYLILH